MWTLFSQHLIGMTIILSRVFAFEVFSHGFYLDEGLELGGKLLHAVDSAVETTINIIKIQ